MKKSKLMKKEQTIHSTKETQKDIQFNSESKQDTKVSMILWVTLRLSNQNQCNISITIFLQYTFP